MLLLIRQHYDCKKIFISFDLSLFKIVKNVKIVYNLLQNNKNVPILNTK